MHWFRSLHNRLYFGVVVHSLIFRNPRCVCKFRNPNFIIAKQEMDGGGLKVVADHSRAGPLVLPRPCMQPVSAHPALRSFDLCWVNPIWDATAAAVSRIASALICMGNASPFLSAFRPSVSAAVAVAVAVAAQWALHDDVWTAAAADKSLSLKGRLHGCNFRCAGPFILQQMTKFFRSCSQNIFHFHFFTP